MSIFQVQDDGNSRTPFGPGNGGWVNDRAADSNPLHERLAQHGIELVCPHRKGRVRKPTQNGRKLRRYRKRWKIERTIAWLHDFRRVVTRYVYAHLYNGFVKLACLMICLRRL
jgi:transposase